MSSRDAQSFAWGLSIKDRLCVRCLSLVESSQLCQQASFFFQFSCIFGAFFAYIVESTVERLQEIWGESWGMTCHEVRLWDLNQGHYSHVWYLKSPGHQIVPSFILSVAHIHCKAVSINKL